MGSMDQNDQITLDFSGPQMTVEEAKVWDVLRDRRGKALAIKGPEIEARTGILYKQVQRIVSTLICHHRKLIGSGTCGYFIPETQDELRQATYYLRHRAIVALVRDSRLRNISLEEVFGQAKMEFEKAS